MTARPSVGARLGRVAMLAMVLAAPAAQARQDSAPAADAAALKAHVAFLAADSMMGRSPERPEFAIAADYVAARFLAAGLAPGGAPDSYLEPVPLVRVRPAGDGRASWSPTGGRAIALAAGVDYFPGTNPGLPHAEATTPVVFVGFGVSAPALGHDDYLGLDVRGKIVAVAAGGPGRLRGEERGVLWDERTKRQVAAAHGAVGMVAVQIDADRDPVPFSTSARAAARPALSWAAADGRSRSGPAAVPMLATLSEAGAYRLFGPRWRRNVDQGRRDDPHYVPLTGAGTLTAVADTVSTPVASENVVGILPGSDPVLAREIVVVSAHLDHLGVGGAGPDRIHNGALDNAIGVAGVVEMARRLAAAPDRPRRTILFLAVTGEEAGLLGSDYFVNDPAMPVGRIVADINLDMPILTYRFEDLIAFGGGHSTLGATMTRVLGEYALASSPDPVPGDSLFIRSDQFSFVRAGIPAVMLWPGRRGAGVAATAAFFDRRYHQPSDDLSQPIDWQAAVRFFAIAADATSSIANASARPRWNDGDVLGKLVSPR